MSRKITQVGIWGCICLILAGTARGASTWYIDDDNCPGPGTGTSLDPFCSIQLGIDASANGDEVLVAAGTYNETIDLHGKAITLRSSDGPQVTIIDATGLNDRVVECTSGEGPDTVLQGFTLTGGRAPAHPGGAGMYNLNSSPTIMQCIIFDNISAIPNVVGNSYGGGMLNDNSSPRIINCVFRNNLVAGWGGGGGMANRLSSNPQIVNSTFYENESVNPSLCGGVYSSGSSTAGITNCILWNNMDASGIGETAQITGTAVVNYSIVQGGWTGMGGAGNVDADPLFFDPNGPDNLIGTQDDDLRLRAGSPAIDAGDNALITVPSDLDGNPRFVDDLKTPDTGNGAPPIVDMGAYEFQGIPIPTLSQWGFIILTLVLLTSGTVIIRRRHPFTARACASVCPSADGAPWRVWVVILGIAVYSSVAWGQVQVGPQIRIDVYGGNAAANETSIASSNFNSDEIVAAWNDYRDSPPNPPPSQQVVRVGVGVSNDGGATWTDFLVRPPANYQSNLEFDPMTGYDDRTGTLWVGGISYFGGAGGLFTARKIVGQPAFEPSVMASVSGYADKGCMTAGPAPGNPNATIVYIAYNLGVIRSTLMGDDWTHHPVSLGLGAGFLPRVGPNGELYVAYLEMLSEYEPGNRIFLRRSFDGCLSFDGPITIATRMDLWWIDIDDPEFITRFPGKFRVPPFTYLAVDKNNGTLYCVYFDTTNIINGNFNVDLYFTKSTNQGFDWTTPVIINGDANPPGDQFFPWIEVDVDGRIHMVFLDSRHTVQNDGDLHGMFDAYYSTSSNGGATWQEIRLTPTSFDSFNDGLNWDPSQFLGDYLGLARGQCRVYPSYLSTQDGNPNIYTHVVTVGPIGACCTGTTCTLAAQACCIGEGGSFKGEGVTCNDCNDNELPDACEAGLRACCVPPLPPPQACKLWTEACCTEVGGDYYPSEKNCDNVDCFIMAPSP